MLEAATTAAISSADRALNRSAGAASPVYKSARFD